MRIRMNKQSVILHPTSIDGVFEPGIISGDGLQAVRLMHADGVLTAWTWDHIPASPRSLLSGTAEMVKDPDGNEYPNRGVYLDVEPGRKIVFTDAFTEAWTPSDKPFFVGTISFEDLGGGQTRYTATARHWSVEDKQAHEQMGFHEGWGICLDQLVEVARAL